MIDFYKELQNFKLIDLKSLEDKNLITSDNIRNSIMLYNKAVNNVRTKNEDIAILELKKALVLNPEFDEALQMLGLCYGLVKNYTKAEEVFKKLSATEKASAIACAYLESISSAKNSSNTHKASRLNNKKSHENKPEGDTSKEKSTPALDLLSGRAAAVVSSTVFRYLAVFIAGAGIMLILVKALVPAPGEVQGLNKDQSSKAAAEAARSKELEDKYNKLSEEFKNLQKSMEIQKTEIDSQKSQNAYYRSVLELFEIEKLGNSGQYEAAADKLIALKTVEFKDAAKEKFESLYNSIMPNAVWAVYTQGNNSYTAKRYQEAIPKLSKIQGYDADWQHMPWTLYQLGICYKEINDKSNALAVFNKITNEYPQTEYAGYSQYRIREISGAQ